MSAALLTVRGLQKRFGGLVATDRVDLDLVAGEIHALIGPNGAGKSTLISQLSGETRHDAGAIRFGDEDVGGLPVPRRVRLGLCRTFQVTDLLLDFTAVDNVALAAQVREGHGFRFIADARRDRDARDRARRQLAVVGLASRADAAVADLSQGERKQLELAVALACGPRLMLLDEPMAGLGPGESERMVQTLTALKGSIAMLLVEHDMDAVFTLADRISVLVYGRIIATGTAVEIRDDPAVRAAYLGEGDV